MPKYSFQREEVLTPKEVEGMLEMSDPLMKSLISFLYLYGCRISEALALTKDDFTLSEKVLTARITVLKRKDKGPLKFKHPVSVSLKAPFVAYLLDRIGMVSEGKIWPISRKTAWRKVHRANPRCSPHWFRHTRATRLAERTSDMNALVDWFGWKDYRTPMKYMHFSGRMAARLSNMVD